MQLTMLIYSIWCFNKYDANDMHEWEWVKHWLSTHSVSQPRIYQQLMRYIFEYKLSAFFFIIPSLIRSGEKLTHRHFFALLFFSLSINGRNLCTLSYYKFIIRVHEWLFSFNSTDWIVLCTFSKLKIHYSNWTRFGAISKTCKCQLEYNRLRRKKCSFTCHYSSDSSNPIFYVFRRSA